MTVFEVIKSRRSIRKYSLRDIEEEKLQTILEAGRLAPSWQNKQCWRFVVVKDKEKIHQLALKSGLISKANFFIKDAAVVIVLCANPKDSGFMNGQYYYLVDTAIAFQQM
ncbi:MAG: nitroreductase family protein, partial [Candidatus Cloacimonadota bacterium]|nr:nitroreductase family protein [Candidatus Cloacimonadota bacterium]